LNFSSIGFVTKGLLAGKISFVVKLKF
jgi:hypothetical protein